MALETAIQEISEVFAKHEHEDVSQLQCLCMTVEEIHVVP